MSRSGSLGSTLAAACALTLWACVGGDPESEPAADVVRDSAGIAIVEFDPDALRVRDLSPDPGWSFASISTEEGEHVLSGVVPLPLESGRVVVAERSTNRVWIGTPDGDDWVWVGGAGDGPTELRRITDLERGADGSIWVFDATRMRLLRFDSGGGFVEALGLPDPYWGGANWSPRSGAHYFLGSSRGTDAAAVGVSRPGVAFVRWSPGSDADTLATVPGIEWYLFDGGAGGTMMAPSTSASGSAGGHWIGDNALPQIEFWTDASTPRTLVRWRAVERDMTSLGDSLLRETLAAIPPEQMSPRVREQLEGFAVTDAEPQFERLVPRGDGGVAIGPWWPRWGSRFVRRPAGLWTIIDASGQAIERVALPLGFVPHWFERDHVIGVSTDELGRERVERWEIDP